MEYEIIQEDTGNGRGTMTHFRVSEPVRLTRSYWDEEDEIETRDFVASAAFAPMSGPETYVFPANEEGEVIKWGELDGSSKGGLDTDKAIEDFVASAEDKEVLRA